MSDIDDNKIRQLDGSLLLVLRELLRQRRTTAAASRLGMSQSAVSHALGRLRIVFDDPLFVRRPHGLEPTRHALALLPQVEEILDAMAEVLGAGTDFDPARTDRHFRIAAPDHVSTVLAPSVVATFGSEAPEATVTFEQLLGQDAVQALQHGEIDLAVGRFGPRLPADVTRHELDDDRYCLVARRGHPAVAGGLTTEVFSSLDHVQISVSGDPRSTEIERLTGAPARRVVAVVPRFLVALPVVARTDVVALAPRRLAVAHADAFGVEVHELPFDSEIRVAVLRRVRDDAGLLWLHGVVVHAAGERDDARAT